MPKIRTSCSRTPVWTCFRIRFSVSRRSGDLIALPQGATPVDFAYEVHSEVGDACVGAEINGNLVQLHTKLKNGDQVKIITSELARRRPNGKNSLLPARRGPG